MGKETDGQTDSDIGLHVTGTGADTLGRLYAFGKETDRRTDSDIGLHVTATG